MKQVKKKDWNLNINSHGGLSGLMVGIELRDDISAVESGIFTKSFRDHFKCLTKFLDCILIHSGRFLVNNLKVRFWDVPNMRRMPEPRHGIGFSLIALSQQHQLQQPSAHPRVKKFSVKMKTRRKRKKEKKKKKVKKKKEKKRKEKEKAIPS